MNVLRIGLHRKGWLHASRTSVSGRSHLLSRLRHQIDATRRTPVLVRAAGGAESYPFLQRPSTTEIASKTTEVWSCRSVCAQIRA